MKLCIVNDKSLGLCPREYIITSANIPSYRPRSAYINDKYKNKRVIVGPRFLSPITARQHYVLLGGVLLVAACCYDSNDRSENIGVLLRTCHERHKNTAVQVTCF